MTPSPQNKTVNLKEEFKQIEANSYTVKMMSGGMKGFWVGICENFKRRQQLEQVLNLWAFAQPKRENVYEL